MNEIYNKKRERGRMHISFFNHFRTTYVNIFRKQSTLFFGYSCPNNFVKNNYLKSYKLDVFKKVDLQENLTNIYFKKLKH